MSDVTCILSHIEAGDPSAAEQLLPLVYDELRKLAAARLAHEKPGQTLQATALVHDAYIRLVDVEKVQHWDSRRHFFAAAAEAMRRILIESARRKRQDKRGAGLHRIDLSDAEPIHLITPEQLGARRVGQEEQLWRIGRSIVGAGPTRRCYSPVRSRYRPGGGQAGEPGCDCNSHALVHIRRL